MILSTNGTFDFSCQNDWEMYSLNGWALFKNWILGLYFIEGNTTADIYLEFLRFEPISVLAIFFSKEKAWFQQDGTSLYFRFDVENYMNEISLLGFFLWGLFKEQSLTHYWLKSSQKSIIYHRYQPKVPLMNSNWPWSWS